MRQQIRRLLQRGTFRRDVAVLMSGTALGQAIVLLAMPMITRLYSPEDFGAFAVFTAIIGVLIVASCGRLELAIPLPRRDAAAFHVVVAGLAVLLAVVLAVAIVSALAGERLMLQLGAGVAASYYWLIPLGVIIGGLYQIASLWSVRKQAFGVVAATRVQQSVVAAGVQVGLGFAGGGPLGLMLGQVLGQGVGVMRLLRRLATDYHKSNTRIKSKGIRWAVKRYRRFIQFDALAGILHALSAQAPAVLLAMYFSPVLAGFYLVAVRLLSVPMGLVGQSISQVLLPNAVGSLRSGQLSALIERTGRVLAMLSFFPFFVIAIFASQYFGVVFGQKWTDAGTTVAWTALWVAIQFVYVPLSVVMLALEAQRANLALQFGLLCTRIAAIVLAAELMDEVQVIAYFSAASAVYYLVGIFILGAMIGGRLSIAVMHELLIAGTIAILPAIAVYFELETHLCAFALLIAVTVYMIRLLRIGGRYMKPVDLDLDAAT